VQFRLTVRAIHGYHLALRTINDARLPKGGLRASDLRHTQNLLLT